MQGIFKNELEYISLQILKDLQTRACEAEHVAGFRCVMHRLIAQGIQMTLSTQNGQPVGSTSKWKQRLGLAQAQRTTLITSLGALLVGALAGCGGGTEPVVQTAQLGPLAVRVGSASGNAVLDNRKQSLVVRHKEGLSVTLEVPPGAIKNGRFSGRLVSGGETVWRLQMVPTASDGVETNCLVDTQIILNDDAESGEFELNLPQLLAQAGCTNTSALRAGARISLSPANQAQPTDLMVQAAGPRKAGGQ